jgi:hypothetical protein
MPPRSLNAGSWSRNFCHLVADGRAKSYVPTDNLESRKLVGHTPAEVIEMVQRSGLAFDATTGTGTTLHMLGAVPGLGKMGFTSIGDSPGEAEELYQSTLRLLDDPAI